MLNGNVFRVTLVQYGKGVCSDLETFYMLLSTSGSQINDGYSDKSQLLPHNSFAIDAKRSTFSVHFFSRLTNALSLPKKIVGSLFNAHIYAGVCS